MLYWIRIHSESRSRFSDKVHAIYRYESRILLESHFTCDVTPTMSANDFK